jgi:hypothetical protein
MRQKWLQSREQLILLQQALMGKRFAGLLAGEYDAGGILLPQQEKHPAWFLTRNRSLNFLG